MKDEKEVYTLEYKHLGGETQILAVSLDETRKQTYEQVTE